MSHQASAEGRNRTALMFADPRVIITAAATVALHHLLLCLLLPRSVFNDDAFLRAVVVHGLFVVLESIAACFVARRFFDDVIGLERIVARQTAELDGRLAGEHGSARIEMIEITETEYRDLLCAVGSDTPRVDILRSVEGWKLEPVERRLTRLAEYARDLARCLDKGPIDVEVESNGLRLSAERWAPLWGALTHVVSNAVDHGLETVAERAGAGKAGAGRITLRTSLSGQHLVVELSDDGRGIDLRGIAACAWERGLPHGTQAELLQAVFAEGLTTRDTATPLSSRGVGMSAVRAACEALGGTIAIHTQAGRGTTIEVSVPNAGGAPMGVARASHRPARAHDLQ